MKHEFQDRIRV